MMQPNRVDGQGTRRGERNSADIQAGPPRHPPSNNNNGTSAPGAGSLGAAPTSTPSAPGHFHPSFAISQASAAAAASHGTMPQPIYGMYPDGSVSIIPGQMMIGHAPTGLPPMGQYLGNPYGSVAYGMVPAGAFYPGQVQGGAVPPGYQQVLFNPMGAFHPQHPGGYPQQMIMPASMGGMPWDLMRRQQQQLRQLQHVLPQELALGGGSVNGSAVSVPVSVYKRGRANGEAKRPSKRAVPAAEEADDEEQVDGVDMGDGLEDSCGGERRLVITFSSMGDLGKRPQRIGKRRAFVPDGLSGRFKMYHENFTFTIEHDDETVLCRDGVERVCITWTVLNEPSAQVTKVVEAPQDALRRQVSGKTICNRVYKEVLEKRALSFEEEMRAEQARPDRNDVKVAHLASMVKLFRPKTFSLGPLAFGLLHTAVQGKMLADALERNFDVS